MADPDRLAPLGLASLATAAAVGAGISLLGLAVVRAFTLAAPVLPWTAPVLLAVAAVSLLVLARITHERLHVRHQRPDPKQSVGTLALARAAMIAGSALAGGYLVFGLFFITRLSAPVPRQRVLVGLVSAVVSVAMVLAGRRLERACRTGEDPDDDDHDTP